MLTWKFRVKWVLKDSEELMSCSKRRDSPYISGDLRPIWCGWWGEDGKGGGVQKWRVKKDIYCDFCLGIIVVYTLNFPLKKILHQIDNKN